MICEMPAGREVHWLSGVPTGHMARDQSTSPTQPVASPGAECFLIRLRSAHLSALYIALMLFLALGLLARRAPLSETRRFSFSHAQPVPHCTCTLICCH